MGLLLVQKPSPTCRINIIDGLRESPNMPFEILNGVLPFSEWIALRWTNDFNMHRCNFRIVLINILDPHQN